MYRKSDFSDVKLSADTTPELRRKPPLHENGWTLLPSDLDPALREELRQTAFEPGLAGKRCMLDNEAVREAAIQLGRRLVSLNYLSPEACAIQAIAFDKSPGTNWKIFWHQDLMFPFAGPEIQRGFDLPSVKDGVQYARPPLSKLEELMAVRLHLDDCHEDNGPLRVSPGSHRDGLIPGERISAVVEARGEVVCLADEGDILLLRPLLLHASSKAVRLARRRVLHFVFDSGPAPLKPWHRSISLA